MAQFQVLRYSIAHCKYISLLTNIFLKQNINIYKIYKIENNKENDTIFSYRNIFHHSHGKHGCEEINIFKV